MIELNRLTDEIIDQKSQNRVLTEYRDFDLSRGERTYKSRLYPYIGGVYDPKFFGSIYGDTCNCGKTDTIGKICQSCGTLVMTEEQKYTRYARIELDYYYVMSTKVKGLINLLSNLSIDYSLAANEFNFSRLSQSSIFKVCELCQFDYKNDQIIANPEITDDRKASYEGLELIIKNHYPDYLEDYKSLVNKKVLVVPAIYRNVSFNPFEYRTQITIPYLTAIYQSIIYLKTQINDELMSTDDPKIRTLLRATLRRMISKLPEQVTSILSPSKENIARNIYSVRQDKSARAAIVGDPDLALDEIRVPIHLAYEICRNDFIKYLMDYYEESASKSEVRYRKASLETLELFEKYSITRRVLLNRPPTLHRYNIQSFKLLLTKDDAIHFPLGQTSPFAGDFDGDALSLTLVPEAFQDDLDKKMSAANMVRYESTNNFIYKPNQEILYGLTLSTKVELQKINDSTQKYLSFKDAEDDFNSQVIQFPCDEVILNDKPTTYALAKLNDILGIDLSEFMRLPVTGGNLGELLTYINNQPNRLELYKEVQKWALEVVTLEGTTIPSMTEMLKFDSSNFTKELKSLIKQSENDPRLISKIDEEYNKFLESELKRLNPEIIDRIKESDRIKLRQVTDIFSPQLLIDDSGKYHIADNPLSKGLTERELRKHAQNNRQLLVMKQELTPKGGYLSRQVKFSGQGMKMNRNESDPENIGIWIKRSLAEGKTTLDGKLLDKSTSDELITVRSVAVTKLPYFTPDMISEVYNKYENGSNLGMKLSSAAAGDITQSGLSLKHFGVVRMLDSKTKLFARNDCKVERISEDILEITENGKSFIHYVPTEFILNGDNFKKGETIGFLPKFITPETVSSYVIDLLGGTSTTDIASGNKRVREWAFNIALDSGKIHYEKDWVVIGKSRVPRDKDHIYNYFEGDQVTIGDIICNGVLNTNIKDYCDSLQQYYYVFRCQFQKLMPQFNEDMYEFIFNCTHVWSDDTLVWVGIKQKVRDDKSWFSNLSYEGARKLVLNTLTNGSTKDNSKDLFNEFFINLLSHEN